jgi:hypothetical protein
MASASDRLSLEKFAKGVNSDGMTIMPPTPSNMREMPSPVVAFHRTELSVILSLYGRMVAAGEWRDYGISSLKDVAVFSVFRRTAEHPLYRIEKRPKLRSKQGMYAVFGMDGQVLRRGHDLKTVLRVLERKLIRAVD